MYSHNTGHYSYVGDQPQQQQQYGTSSGRSTPVHGIGGYGYYQQNLAASPASQGMSQQYSNVQQRDPGRTTSGGSQGGSGVYHASGGYSSGGMQLPSSSSREITPRTSAYAPTSPKAPSNPNSSFPSSSQRELNAKGSYSIPSQTSQSGLAGSPYGNYSQSGYTSDRSAASDRAAISGYARGNTPTPPIRTSFDGYSESGVMSSNIMSSSMPNHSNMMQQAPPSPQMGRGSQNSFASQRGEEGDGSRSGSLRNILDSLSGYSNHQIAMSSSIDSKSSTGYGAPAPAAPLSNTGSAFGADREKESLRARNEELQTLADKQAQDLRRRNEELLDLQRNHEAFREKFILFREGMRTKNDETDAKFRGLQDELNASKAELAVAQLGRSADGTGAQASSKLRELEEQASSLTTANKLLQEELAAARKAIRAGAASAAEGVVAESETSNAIIKDLRMRIENQAEYIRSQNSKMSEFEQKLSEGKDLTRDHALASEDLKVEQEKASEARRIAAELDSRLQAVQRELEEERLVSSKLHGEVDTLRGKELRTRADCEMQSAKVLEAVAHEKSLRARADSSEAEMARLSKSLKEVGAAKEALEAGSAAASEKARVAEGKAGDMEAEAKKFEVKVSHLEQQLNLTRQQVQQALERNSKLQEQLQKAEERPALDPDMPLAIEDLRKQVQELKSKLNSKGADLDSKVSRVDELELALRQAKEENQTQIRAQQHENKVFSETRARAQAEHDLAVANISKLTKEVEEAKEEKQALSSKVEELTASRTRAAEDNANLRAQLEAANDANQQTAKIAGEHERMQRAAVGKLHDADEEVKRLKADIFTRDAEIESLNSALASARENARMYREHSANMSASDASASERRLQISNERIANLEAQLMQSTATVSELQQALNRPRGGGAGGVAGGAGDMQLRARLVRSRDVLLAKLIGNWQKQTMGRSFAAWLRSIEANKMDRILMESDKYMSMDSSIDDLLNDALSKRRARSIVASSASLGGSSIDDEMLERVNRPMSGGSVASFGGSSLSGSLEWMV